MADKRISELSAITSVTSADVMPIVQNNATSKVTIQTLFTNIPTDISCVGKYVDASQPDAVTESGTISASTSITYVSNATINSVLLTLANGVQGQEKTIVCIGLANPIVLTPSILIGATHITFSNVGHTCKLQYLNGAWYILSLFGATIS
jgi:hypothetical protein